MLPSDHSQLVIQLVLQGLLLSGQRLLAGSRLAVLGLAVLHLHTTGRRLVALKCWSSNPATCAPSSGPGPGCAASAHHR